MFQTPADKKNKTKNKKKLPITPGVVITQYTINIPEGKSTPDFQCKPNPITIEEGKLAVFKAVVTGDPKPEVSWRRGKGNMSDKDKFQSKYDQSTGEYILEVMSAAETDVYKCYVVNEYGKAVGTTTLNVTEGKSFGHIQTNIFLNIFSKEERRDGETDERFWDAMLNADRKDYECICKEFGVTDLHLILKKLEEKKAARVQNEYILHIYFEVRSYLELNGAIPNEDTNKKYNLKCAGEAKDLSIMDLMQRDTGLNQVDAEEIHFLSTEFKLSNVDFVIKIQEIKAQEREDALFECVLTHPLPKITWMGKGSVLEDGEKYSITVSDHKMIHRLLIKDCKLLDKGIYSAVAGITSCSAWLVVETEDDSISGKKKPRKTTVARGVWTDLEKVAKEQQIKNQEEMEKILAAVKAKYKAEQLKEGNILKNRGRDGEITAVTGPGKNTGAVKGNPDTANSSAPSEPNQSKEKAKINKLKGGAAVSTLNASGSETKTRVQVIDNANIKKHAKSGQADFDSSFIAPVTVKVGQNAIFKLCFVGHEPIKIQWYRDGEELQDDNNTKIEKSAGHSRLLLIRCQRKDTGEIKIKLKNEHGFIEAISQLVVLDKPTSPSGPAEVTEGSPTCIEFKWRPPKDDGGSPVIRYIVERQQVGRNTWKKIGEIPGVPGYRDTDVDHGRKYYYRIRAITAEGTSEVMETDEMQAGTLAFPGPPAPPMVVSAYDHCINLSWASPSNTGGSRILGYILEKRKKGSNLWTVVNANDELIKENKYAVKDVVAGMEYEFRVTAINLSGAGEFSNPSEFVFARDPKMRPKFTNHKMKSFVVVRAGNSVRITINFEASPQPDIIWLKDNVLVTKRVTISNSDGSSQLLIPSSERSDSGIYSILVKNLAGQETFSTEVRVTDDPKPPGPVELVENVPGTVTVIWEASPDEKRDDRLHYTVSKLDSTKRTWTTVADRLFNNKFTVCNIMHGREYHFRVYAKNDMGISAPSESPTWGKEKKKGVKECDLQCAPTFIVPLKLHTAPKGYECYMTCAVKGNPKPHITWYRNHISLNTNTNYYISNTCGVCSMLILRVGPRDMGEYTITAENALGRVECSTILSVRGEREVTLYLNRKLSFRWRKSPTINLMTLNFVFSLPYRVKKLRTPQCKQYLRSISV
uniref:Immunoglobulin like and fibronectin type III domain containing 1, tandem duplicate 2 n=1 Tax=Mastacembelus armatus TaxID=205130 RepID=A0A3Q3NNZ4_9TELE